MGEIDFERIDSILEKAEKEGRTSLFEHEVYSVLEEDRLSHHRS